jgi:hypothetical protein
LNLNIFIQLGELYSQRYALTQPTKNAGVPDAITSA